MKWTREEYIAYMNFEDVGKQMFTELFGPLVQLDSEWRAQGATEEEINMIAFDWDYVPLVDCGANLDVRDGFEEKILEDNEKYLITIDKLGRKMILCKSSASRALPVEYPVKDMDDWMKIKPFFQYHKDRINWDSVENAKKLQSKGHLVCEFINGGFAFPRELFGDENLCYAYYDQPELIQDMLETYGDMIYRVLDEISEKLVIDNFSFQEDMAGKSGPLIGPSLVNEFCKPFYEKLIHMLRSKGTTLFSQDSDGNMNPLIDCMIDSGINIMYPEEPAAGMDIVQIRKKYGKKIALKGGIDKHVLRKSKSDIRAELEYKMQPMMQEGGMAFSLDHRITNGTPIENYRYYVNLGRELLGREPIDNLHKGWQRQAF